MDDYYSKDKSNVYFYDSKIKSADPKSFTILSSSHSKDKNNVYYYGEKITGADSETFKILEENLAADRRNIYFKQTKLTDIDRKTFIFLGTKCIDKQICAEKVSFFKDKNGEYNTSEME